MYKFQHLFLNFIIGLIKINKTKTAVWNGITGYWVDKMVNRQNVLNLGTYLMYVLYIFICYVIYITILRKKIIENTIMIAYLTFFVSQYCIYS